MEPAPARLVCHVLQDAPDHDRLLSTEADPLARELARGPDPGHRRGRHPAQAPDLPHPGDRAARRAEPGGDLAGRSRRPPRPAARRSTAPHRRRHGAARLDRARSAARAALDRDRGAARRRDRHRELRPAGAPDRLVLPGPGRDRRPLPVDRPLHRPARAVAPEPALLPVVRGVERVLHPGRHPGRPAPGRRHRQGPVRGRGAGASPVAAADAPLLPHLPGRPPAARLDPPPAAVPLPARDVPRRAAVGPHRQRRPLPARLAQQHRDGQRAAAARPRRAAASSSRSR